jgi:hypothetical protein
MDQVLSNADPVVQIVHSSLAELYFSTARSAIFELSRVTPLLFFPTRIISGKI